MSDTHGEITLKDFVACLNSLNHCLRLLNTLASSALRSIKAETHSPKTNTTTIEPPNNSHPCHDLISFHIYEDLLLLFLYQFLQPLRHGRFRIGYQCSGCRRKTVHSTMRHVAVAIPACLSVAGEGHHVVYLPASTNSLVSCVWQRMQLFIMTCALAASAWIACGSLLVRKAPTCFMPSMPLKAHFFTIFHEGHGNRYKWHPGCGNCASRLHNKKP